MANKNEIDDPKFLAFMEILSFLDTHVGVSYNDLVTYAYENDKKDWLAAFRSWKYRKMIAQCAKEKRQIDDVPYTNKLIDSMKSRAKAQKEYEERNPLWFVDDQ